jgi:hypothetical protein
MAMFRVGRGTDSNRGCPERRKWVVVGEGADGSTGPVMSRVTEVNPRDLGGALTDTTGLWAFG